MPTGKAHTRAMPRGPTLFRTRAHLLLCTGPRCRERGAERLFEEAWAALEAERLAYYCAGGTLRLTESGCLGACAHGPNLTCYHRASDEGPLDEAWYAGVDLRSFLAVARAAHAGERLPDDGRYDG